MTNSEELQKVFEEKIRVEEFLKRVEENPSRVQNILRRLKEENRGPLIEAATDFFTDKGEIDQQTKGLIEKEVNAYLEDIASRAQKQVGEVSWQERAKKRLLSFTDFVRVHKSTFIAVAILMVMIVGIAFLVSSVGQNTAVSKLKPQTKAVISLAQGQITVQEKGKKEATITVKTPLAASEILLYENSKVIGRDHGGILKKTVFHQEGTYIYFAEIFMGSEKSITDQKSVTYGGEEK